MEEVLTSLVLPFDHGNWHLAAAPGELPAFFENRVYLRLAGELIIQ
jgi:hypothetical protein